MASNLSDQIAFLLPIILLLSVNISFVKPMCHRDERSALLQFKQSFVIDTYASRDPSSYPKVESWNSSNCCMWDGVECDEVSGHVIGLYLSSSCLYGSFNSNSSLFKLSLLESLNLADNNFNFSRIPSKTVSLSNLIYLNLSLSYFSGQIPMEISELHSLTFLDLHGNYDRENYADYLSLEDFRSLVKNLTKLEALDLSLVNISNSLPDIFMNLHSLTYLSLGTCNLNGAVPSSLGGLTNLELLDLSGNNFAGLVPSWLENLTELLVLNLSNNNFTKGGFSWLGKQTKLKYLMLQNVNLVGEIPFCLRNLTHLELLNFRQNSLESQIPTWLSNLTQLTKLDLGQNELNGSIPESLSQLVNLEDLNLSVNNLSGTFSFEMFKAMKQMDRLQLSGNNNLTVLIDDSINATFNKFFWLGLNRCNLRKFPDFLRYQNQLRFIDLSENFFEGDIPSWVGNIGRETLMALHLSYNYFSGFEHPLTFSLLENLLTLDLAYNMLQGPLPPPPLFIQNYKVSFNNLTGEISSWFCNLKSLGNFDLSNNNLSGKIPRCLGNSTDNLVIMFLDNNHFNGNIPDIFGNESILQMISLSNNQLEGSLPRSLANCKRLQLLDLSGNQISDIFPIWLGSLPELEVLTLRSNYFFGALGTADDKSSDFFPELRILDLSRNEFTGSIPSGFYQTFTKMKAFDLDQMAYMQGFLRSLRQNFTVTFSYSSSIYMANKGLDMKYWKIPVLLAAIDFSSNKFQGGIPDSLATLKMINVLNLSNNHLSGHIPSFLRNLTNLESLDLSSNNFSGKIPQQLVELTFLEYFNVSNNQLMGSIPHGQQFNTFDNTSYTGNSELCGLPLSRKCGNSVPPAQPRNGGSKLPIDVGWKSVGVGYGSGIVVGVVSGLVFYKRHQTLLLYTFGRWPAQRLSGRRRGRRAVH